MRSHWFAGVASAAAILAAGCPALAQVTPPGGVTIPGGGLTIAPTIINLTDGTRIEQTILSPTSIRINISGGPQFTANPATVNVTNLTLNGAETLYSGNVVTGGVTTPFNCRLNTSTNTVSGDAICGTAFGGQSAPTTTPTTPVTTPPTTTTAPPPTTPTTTTTNPNGTTTVTTPTATVTFAAQQEQALIRNVQAEQFLLSMVADRVSVANAQSYLAGRLQAMEMAGLAPSGISLGRAGGGMAAGEGGPKIGLWANASGAYLKDSRIAGGVDGHDTSAAIGLDLSGRAFTVGVFGIYDRIKLDGASSVYKSDGWSGGGYARWSPSPQFRVTGSLGAGSQDVLFDRSAGALRSRGETDRDQLFGSVSIDSQLSLTNQLIAVPSAGLLFSNSENDGYIDQAGRAISGSDTDMTLGVVGGSLYYQASGFLPFVQASLNHQFNREVGVDRTYATIGAGFVAPIGGAASAVVGVQTLLWKRQERETRLNVSLRRNF